MSKARQLADLGSVTTRLDEVGNTDGALSNRNMVLNGAMQVAQRGVSFTASGYTLDRWRSVADTAIVTQKVEDTVGGKKVAVLQSVATPGHTYHAVLQRIEGMRRIQGQTLTLSAWVKGSAGTFAQYVEFRNATGNVVLGISFNFTFTGNWQKLEWTFAAPTATAFDDDAAWYNVSFYAGDSLSLTMVQLEVGDTATPFEHHSIGQELALCQRYFQTSYPLGTPAGTAYANNCYKGSNPLMWHGATPAWSNANNSINLLVEMRTSPSMTFYGVNTGVVGRAGGTYCSSTTDDLAMYGNNATTKQFSTYAGGAGYVTPTQGNWACNWTLDAEL